MTKVEIADDFFGNDPVHAGRPFENTLAHRPERDHEPVSAEDDTALTEEEQVARIAAKRARLIAEGIRISMDAHPTPKVLEHSEEDIRLTIKNKNPSSKV